MRGLVLCSLVALLQLATSSVLAPESHRRDVVPRQTSTNSSVLDVFQVYKPVTAPTSGKCVVEKVLMEHVFGYSYGAPFVGNYTPPSCEFNSVVMTFTSTIAGRQFDRLALMFLGDIEVWRMSTAEPTAAGIIFEYTKDMSQYLSLWKQPQTVIFDLGNIVDDTYTGSFTTTLTATFFYKENAPVKADLILPISSEQGSSGSSSVFTVPGANATVQQTIPSDALRAVVSISANGQSTEEFWYTNVLSSEIYTFEDTAGTLYGYSPFREVQLYIDGMLAGVEWPFPIIFTGGIAPGFWRPVVGIDAFDLRESEIDITPFLPYLMDGKPHSFTLKVVGVDDNGGTGSATLSDSSVGSYWLVTAKIFIFTGKSTYKGPHYKPLITGVAPKVHTTEDIVTASDGTNQSLTYSVTASRSFSVSSTYGIWYQSLSYSNNGFLNSGGLFQTNVQSTSGSSTDTDLSDPTFSSYTSFSYPLSLNSTYGLPASGGVTIDAELEYGLHITSTGRPDISVYTLVAGPSELDTTRTGSAHYSSQPNNSYSYGDNVQDFKQTSYGSTYIRDVHAINSTVVSDSVGGYHYFGQPSSWKGPLSVRPSVNDPRGGARAFLGRGPGKTVVASP